MSRPDPYVLGTPNDLITSERWNEIQIRAREDIAALQSQVLELKAALERHTGGLAAEKAAAERVAAEMAADEADAKAEADKLAKEDAEALEEERLKAVRIEEEKLKPRAIESLRVVRLVPITADYASTLSTLFDVATLAQLRALPEASITAATKPKEKLWPAIKKGRKLAEAVLATEPDPTLPAAFLQYNLAALAAMSPDALLAAAFACQAPNTPATRAAIADLAKYLVTLSASLDPSWLKSAEATLAFVTKSRV